MLFRSVAAACGTSTGGDADARVDDVDALGRPCSATIGELARAIEVRPVYVDNRGDVVPIGAGGAVELVAPPQGGQVLLVGLEARNVRGCTATITGRLRDGASGRVLGEDVRGTQLVLGDDGWGHLSFPPIATAANVTACPIASPPRDIDGSPWTLELAIEDERGARATWMGEVVPGCPADAPDPATCPCQCDADFVFGQPCPVDP